MLGAYSILFDSSQLLLHPIFPKKIFVQNLLILSTQTNFVIEYTSFLYSGFSLGLIFFFFVIPFVFLSPISVGLSGLVEEEINSVDDLIVFIGLLGVVFIGFFSNFFGGFMISIMNLNILLLSAFLIFVISVIAGFLIFFGYYIPIYINGAAKTNSFLWNFIIDSLSVFSFITRFVVQLVRIIILLVTYYFSSLLFHELGYNNSLDYTNSSTLGSFLLLVVRVLFEIAHLLVILGMQTTAFCFILF